MPKASWNPFSFKMHVVPGVCHGLMDPWCVLFIPVPGVADRKKKLSSSSMTSEAGKKIVLHNFFPLFKQTDFFQNTRGGRHSIIA